MPRPYSTPYHEDDDLDITRGPYRAPSRAGLVSGISALVSLGLLAMIGILGILLSEAGNQDESGLILVGIIFLDLAVFASSLVGLVQGFRSQGREQVEFRGVGMAGLIGSILALLAAVAIGVAAMCFGLLIAVVQNGGGG